MIMDIILKWLIFAIASLLTGYGVAKCKDMGAKIAVIITLGGASIGILIALITGKW